MLYNHIFSGYKMCKSRGKETADVPRNAGMTTSKLLLKLLAA
jgi:hypothetical protein